MSVKIPGLRPTSRFPRRNAGGKAKSVGRKTDPGLCGVGVQLMFAIYPSRLCTVQATITFHRGTVTCYAAAEHQHPLASNNNNTKLCGRPPQYAPPTASRPLTLKVVSESRVTWTTSVPILVFRSFSVLDLGAMYATDRRQTASSLNAPPVRAGT